MNKYSDLLSSKYGEVYKLQYVFGGRGGVVICISKHFKEKKFKATLFIFLWFYATYTM